MKKGIVLLIALLIIAGGVYVGMKKSRPKMILPQKPVADKNIQQDMRTLDARLNSINNALRDSYGKLSDNPIDPGDQL